jgi:hypothetical protein
MTLVAKWWKKEMVTGQEFGMGIGGCNRLCATATGHILVALFPYLRRLRTVHCWTLVKSQTYCLWKQKGLLLSCRGFWLFSDRLIRGGDRWRSKHHIEAEPQVWGLGVQVWTGT